MKYLQIINTSFQVYLTYRARILIWAFVDTINFVIFPFIWLAIFGERQTIGGYTRADLVTYYIIVAFISFAASSHVSERIRREIMKGDLNTVLVKPVYYFFLRSVDEISYKLITLIIALPLFVLLYFLFPTYVQLPRSFLSLLLFLVALCLSFIISNLVQFIIGLGTFWLGETGALQQLRHIAERIFAGEIAPLTFLPSFLRTTASVLPFQFLSYIPAQIYLGQLSFLQTLHTFIAAGIWIVALGLFVSFLWRRGVRHYEGVGI